MVRFETNRDHLLYNPFQGLPKHLPVIPKNLFAWPSHGTDAHSFLLDFPFYSEMKYVYDNYLACSKSYDADFSETIGWDFNIF